MSYSTETYEDRISQKHSRREDTHVVTKETITNMQKELEVLKIQLNALIEAKEAKRIKFPDWAKLALATSRPNQQPDAAYYVIKK